MMIFRQLFDGISCTYTYLLASHPGGEALIIDSVLEKVDRYLQLLDELNLTLAKSIDTHIHADHLTGLGALRDATHCVTVMGKESQVDRVSMRVGDGDRIEIEGLALDVLHTPGHTDDSYSFLMDDRVFTGDTLLIRGTGRTDFQHGDAYAAYNSLFNKLLTLPDETRVYPGHDYKGDTESTIGEEKAFNPRLQVTSAEEYAEIMNNMKLPNPMMMDEVVPANLTIGFSDDTPDIREHTISANQAIEHIGHSETLFIDLREESERTRDGVIPGSVHMPYQTLRANIKPGGLLAAIASNPKQELMLYCAFGERSALAYCQMHEAGFVNTCHLEGGIDAWIKAGGPVEQKVKQNFF